MAPYVFVFPRAIQSITSSIFFRFQGEKNEGFGVLYANMKCGIMAIKELADFLKERAKLEEENSKAHAKLSKQVKENRNLKILKFK